MSLETAITRAWQRQALWLWLLMPISWVYGLITALRQQSYKLGLSKSYCAPVAVMVIGNITVGGSGKTPLIMALVNHLQQRKVRVGVISRGYGGDTTQMPALVTADSLPSVVGDEPSLIVSITGVPMAVCPNRQQAIEALLNHHPDLQLIIADDGLQHYALQRDIEWIVVDVARGFGNRQLLPTGFLREPMSRLTGATVVYHEKLDNLIEANNRQAEQRLTMHLQPDALRRLWPITKQSELSESFTNNDAPISGQKIHAVSGIGYPQRFFTTLEDLGYNITPHPYPDHYDFVLTDLLQYKQQAIVVTSKDAVKIRTLLADVFNNTASAKIDENIYSLVARLWVLPVIAELSVACYVKLQMQLTHLGINYKDR